MNVDWLDCDLMDEVSLGIGLTCVNGLILCDMLNLNECHLDWLDLIELA